MVLRILLATCLLPRAAESSFLWRSRDHHRNYPDGTDPAAIPGTTPSVVFDEASAAAIAEREALYLSLREDYLNEGCDESWGEFPSATTTTSPERISMDSNIGNGMMCKCGMIYDLASSAFFDESDLGREIDAAAAEASDDESSSSSTTMTKMESWVLARTAHSYTRCGTVGSAKGFPCQNVDLVAHIPLSSMRTTNTREAPRLGSDVWGWTSRPTKREFIIWGVREGHFFLEVNGADDPTLLGFLPTTLFYGMALQHDVKILGDYAYLGSEGNGHGIQIFDMTRLLSIEPSRDCVSDLYCMEHHPDRVYHGTQAFPIGYSHNLVVNEDNPNAVYVVGSESCNGGIHVMDVSDPLNPTFGGCFGDDGYVHDAHCVDYDGPDATYAGREICFCFDEDTVTIVDVTNKSNMEILSRTGYATGYKYTHQGWLSSDQSHLVFGDEADEYHDSTMNTRTLVLNVEDLRNPSNLRAFFGTSNAVDHNQYVVSATHKGQGYWNMHGTDLIYQANYKAGMRILQVVDYETADFVEVGYFDTAPLNDDNKFEGAWSTFPYFKSGVVVISSIEEGLFLVKPDLEPSLVDYDDCSDDVSYRFENKASRTCEWVENSRNNLYRKTKCKKKWLGKPVSHHCRETCGEVGLGPRKCREKRRRKRKDKKKNRRSNAAAFSETIAMATIETKETAGTDRGIENQRRKRRKYIRGEADEVIIPL